MSENKQIHDCITPGVNFTNILRAVYALIFLHQKSTNLNCKYKKLNLKLLYEKAASKMLVKLTPDERKASVVD
jgi:hypothetical protein